MNTTVPAEPADRCPSCGEPLPSNAPRGLCPKCLMQAAAAPTEPDPGSSHRPAPPSLEVVQAAFPHLEILELIGAGGMGAVFKARQPKLDRLVALKVLAEPLRRHPAFAERFHREARLLARLNHPNIVSVFDFGESNGLFYLMMEHVDGVNLRQAMRAGRFTPPQALDVVPKICEALQFAHEHGVLHRDIKPENILLDAKGRVKIADFGIAKLVGAGKAEVTLTASGAALGTPAYMAPEQLERPGEVDHRADIYSLGVVFYEMLTGELPLGRFAPPSQKTPLDQRVDDIVLRALAKEKELRQQSAGEVKTEVERVTSDAAESSQVASVASSRKPWPDDFILCNPRLPRMAQAITVYGLLLAPLLWVLGLTLVDFTHLPKHPGAAAIEALRQFLVDVLGGLATTMVLLVGALKLRGLRPGAVGWLKAGIWSRIGLLILAIVAISWSEALAWEEEVGLTRLPLSEAILCGVALLAVGFEISVLVWLRRNQTMLRALCHVRRPSPETKPSTVPNASEIPIRTSWKAVISAVLSIPMWLQSLVICLLALISLLHQNSGQPAREFFLLFSLGGGLGLAGLILGVLALGDIRRGGGRIQGAGLAIMGVLGAPFSLALLLVPSVLLSLAAAGKLPVPLGGRLFQLAPLWLGAFLVVGVLLLKRWVTRPASTEAAARKTRAVILGAIALLLLVDMTVAPFVADMPETTQTQPVIDPHKPPPTPAQLGDRPPEPPAIPDIDRDRADTRRVTTPSAGELEFAGASQGGSTGCRS